MNDWEFAGAMMLVVLMAACALVAALLVSQ